MSSSFRVSTVGFTLPSAANIRFSSRSLRVPTIEPRTVIPLRITLFALFLFVALSGLLLGWKKNSGGYILPVSQRGASTELKEWLPLDTLSEIAIQSLPGSSYGCILQPLAVAGKNEIALGVELPFFYKAKAIQLGTVNGAGIRGTIRISLNPVFHVASLLRLDKVGSRKAEVGKIMGSHNRLAFKSVQP